MQGIKEVIERLKTIVSESEHEKDPLGFFAVLYLQVTERVWLGIQNEEFEDNARMERLDVIFAERYLEAYQAHRAKQALTQSWQAAFKAADDPRTLILQHLLLGINAHINLDLGIAAAQTVGQHELQSLQADFDLLNKILAEMVEGVQDKLSKASPLMRVIDWLGGSHDEYLASFSINLARDGAWVFAQEWHKANSDQRLILLNERDQRIAEIGNFIARPRAWWLRLLLRPIRWFENKNATAVIQLMRVS